MQATLRDRAGKQQEGGKAGSERLGVRALRAKTPATSRQHESSARFQGKYFWFWSSKNKNAFSPLQTFPPSRLPVLSEGPRDELSARQQPGRSFVVAL
jgi:hypothetical protein